MFQRLCSPSKASSFFLFGARATGKSTLLKAIFSDYSHHYVDLLNPELQERFSRRPGALKEECMGLDRDTWVLIDEVQKVPALLDVVHQLIHERGQRFALTGSSARKLRGGAANLLAGRAFMYHLFPLSSFEYGNKFNLHESLRWGTLPAVQNFADASDRRRFLQAYTRTYLSEEVWNEHLIRNLDPFRRFLEVAAQGSGKILNYSKIAQDVGVDYKTVQRYYDILADTLVGFFLEPYHPSVRKSQRKSPKFYFFDTGLVRSLQRMTDLEVAPGTFEFGNMFEHFVILELFRLNSYLETDFRFSYFSTTDGAEIDVIVERPGKPLLLLEIKSTPEVLPRHVVALSRLGNTFDGAEKVCLSQDVCPRVVEGVDVMPWQMGLKTLFNI